MVRVERVKRDWWMGEEGALPPRVLSDSTDGAHGRGRTVLGTSQLHSLLPGAASESNSYQSGCPYLLSRVAPPFVGRYGSQGQCKVRDILMGERCVIPVRWGIFQLWCYKLTYFSGPILALF